MCEQCCVDDRGSSINLLGTNGCFRSLLLDLANMCVAYNHFHDLLNENLSILRHKMMKMCISHLQVDYDNRNQKPNDLQSQRPVC